MTNPGTELHWSTIRDHATDLFGEAPGKTIEPALIEIFELAPMTVIRAIETVGESLKRGDIRSGWPILHARLTTSRQPVRDATVKAPDERGKRIAQAETWMRNCGPHFDSQTELEDELFGDRGLLKPWADDDALKARMLSAWREQRPRGEQIKREQAEADERWATSHTCKRCGNMRPFLMAPCPHCRRVTTTVELGRNEPALGRTPEPALGGAK